MELFYGLRILLFCGCSSVGAWVGRTPLVRSNYPTSTVVGTLAMVTSSTGENVKAETIASTPSASSTNTTVTWYPTRIQETVDDYHNNTSLYVRHILVESLETARLAVDLYLQTNFTSSTNDPFGSVVQLLSTCPSTKNDGGRVGWVDGNNSNRTTNMVLSMDVVQELFQRRPKTGDVHIVAAKDTNQVHVVKVDDLWHAVPMSSHRINGNRRRDALDMPIGTFHGSNQILNRPKLKGQGVLPKFPDAPKTYSIQTAGCQMNAADSERLAGVLERDMGLSLHNTSEDGAVPDVVVFNTCSIRDHAEQKLYDSLGPYAARKRNGEQLALVVTGCVAQQEGESLLRRVPEIDVVLGPQYVPHLQSILESVEWGKQVVVTQPILHQEDFTRPIRGHDVKAWVNVIYGCNEHCTYCVVPGVRGMEQSRPMEGILQECMDLAQQGYKEVTLLGQNIDAYGRDMVPKRTFADLLVYLNAKVPEKMRIRYVTSHPRYFSDRVIDAVANLDHVCECFHMPFQAGGNEVLKNMRRGYTYESYMNIIRKIREKAPDASICGDVIVGFPGESDEAFQRTLDLMNEVKFDNLNTFAYSPRPNTEAAIWENQVPEDVKAKRLQLVQQLAAEHGLERSMRYVGRAVEVLVEDPNPRNPKQIMGRTRQGRKVFFNGDMHELRGKLVDVRITEARTWSLMGELVKQ